MRPCDVIAVVFIDFHWFSSIFIILKKLILDGPTNQQTNQQMQPLIEMQWHIEKWFISKFGFFLKFKNFKIWSGGFGGSLRDTNEN